VKPLEAIPRLTLSELESFENRHPQKLEGRSGIVQWHEGLKVAAHIRRIEERLALAEEVVHAILPVVAVQPAIQPFYEAWRQHVNGDRVCNPAA